MNSKDRAILVGMVLGDGYLNVRTRLNQGKYRYESSAIRLKHSVKQIDYLRYKAEILRRMFGGKVTIGFEDTRIGERVHKMCYVDKSNTYFRVLRSFMYPEGKKQFTRRVLDMLTPHGIAIWYMDDGSAGVNRNKSGWVTSCYTNLSTHCTEAEAVVICDYFREVHEIEFRKGYEKGRYIVRANTAASQKFARLVEPYVIPSMRYKLAHVANLHLHECRTTKTPVEDIVQPNGN